MAMIPRAGFGTGPAIHPFQRRNHELPEDVSSLIYWFVIPFCSIIFLIFAFYLYTNIRYWHDDQIHGPSWKPVVLLYRYWTHRLRKFCKRRVTKANALANWATDTVKGRKPLVVRRRVLIRALETAQRPFRAHVPSFRSADYESEYDKKGEMIRLAQLRRIESDHSSLTLVPTRETIKSMTSFSSEAETVIAFQEPDEHFGVTEADGSESWLSYCPATRGWDEGVEFEYMSFV